MLFISDVQYYVPLKLCKTAGSIHLFKITGMLTPEYLKLKWDAGSSPARHSIFPAHNNCFKRNYYYLFKMELYLGYHRNSLEGSQGAFKGEKSEFTKISNNYFKRQIQNQKHDEERTFTLPHHAKTSFHFVHPGFQHSRVNIDTFPEWLLAWHQTVVSYMKSSHSIYQRTQ